MAHQYNPLWALEPLTTPLKTWVPALDDVAERSCWPANTPNWFMVTSDTLFAVRAAYQIPVDVTMPGAAAKETAYPYTFEDALVFESDGLLRSVCRTGIERQVSECHRHGGRCDVLWCQHVHRQLKNGKKAEFALDVLMADNFNDLKVPVSPRVWSGCWNR